MTKMTREEAIRVLRNTAFSTTDGVATIERIKQAIDALEVVCCKDCKHRIENEHYGERGYMKLKAMCELDTGDPYGLGRYAEVDEWFCADGEKNGAENGNAE